MRCTGNSHQITFETYGRRHQFLYLDGPHAIVRLTVQGWPLAVDRFIAAHTILLVETDRGFGIQPWQPFAQAVSTADVAAIEHYDYEEPVAPCLHFHRVIPLPDIFYAIDDPYGVGRATLRGQPPIPLQKNILAQTGVDIRDPALSWQRRYELCAIALSPAWRRSLASAMHALDNQRLFDHETIESWALKYWGGSNALSPDDIGRIGNDPVSHRLWHAKGHHAVEMVFLIYNDTNDDMPNIAPIFEMLAISHPLLQMTMDCRAFDPRYNEREFSHATSDRGQIAWAEPEIWDTLRMCSEDPEACED